MTAGPTDRRDVVGRERDLAELLTAEAHRGYAVRRGQNVRGVCAGEPKTVGVMSRAQNALPGVDRSTVNLSEARHGSAL